MEHPKTGGVWNRDPTTGALSAAGDAPPAPAPSTPLAEAPAPEPARVKKGR